MKHKWAPLMTMQPEIYHQNSQSFYPSEPSKNNHITMRHPVGKLWKRKKSDNNWTRPEQHLTLLKVRQSCNVFFKPTILPKSKCELFCLFRKNWRIAKSPFEINWPLSCALYWNIWKRTKFLQCCYLAMRQNARKKPNGHNLKYWEKIRLGRMKI